MVVDVNERILRERNKLVYMNNVISAVLDLSLNEKAAAVVLIFLKQMGRLMNRLIN